MAGFIKLHRGWRDSEVFFREAFTRTDAWVWLIENAAWKMCQRRNAHGNLVAVQRGQIHTSSRALGTVWGWSKNKVERFLADLEKCRMVDRVTDQHGMLVTLCNYEKYQSTWTTDEPQDGTDADQARTTQEEGKESKEGKKGGFAFHGRVIKLVETDLARWKAAYHLLDLPAVLQNRDDWLASQPEEHRKRWFQSTSSHLAKLQQEAADKLRNQPKPIKVGI